MTDRREIATTMMGKMHVHSRSSSAGVLLLIICIVLTITEASVCVCVCASSLMITSLYTRNCANCVNTTRRSHASLADHCRLETTAIWAKSQTKEGEIVTDIHLERNKLLEKEMVVVKRKKTVIEILLNK